MQTPEQSPFLSLPPEVREAIYADLIPNALHVFLRQGKLAIYRCVAVNTAENLTGGERATIGNSGPDPVWARRLRSSWGPHWQCEEAAFDVDRGETAAPLLFVCKRIHAHIVNFMARTATFHVTDLETLECLAQSHLSFGSLSTSTSPYGLLHAVGPLLRKLSITLRLPLLFFEAVSSHASHATASTSSENTQLPGVMATRQSSLWIRVWPALALQLKQLQSLHLWLDHDDRSSWSFVDERAAISYFTASMSPDKIPTLEDVSVNLPNLHPRHEKPECHFTKGSPQPPTHVTLKRRLRQRFFHQETIPGYVRVAYQADFPIMHEFIDAVEFEEYGCTNMTREEFEDWERGLWERGEDVDDLFLGLQYQYGLI